MVGALGRASRPSVVVHSGGGCGTRSGGWWRLVAAVSGEVWQQRGGSVGAWCPVPQRPGSRAHLLPRVPLPGDPRPRLPITSLPGTVVAGTWWCRTLRCTRHRCCPASRSSYPRPCSVRLLQAWRVGHADPPAAARPSSQPASQPAGQPAPSAAPLFVREVGVSE
ncbi:hypothetical protein O3P69_000263 [Scylla paramamosain]|uniref:Uncharacterized protein n=1 Tax=Scylla paramamosain TaxID=85552 RepID=A0AAW0UXY8_SCYPA